MAQNRIATLLLKLNADTSGLSGPLKQMSREIADAARKSQSAFAGFNRLGASLSEAGLRLSAGITAPLAGVATAALMAAGKLEQTQTAFTTLTGSATKARQVLEGIRQFADRTPFEFPDLARAGQRILAFGFDASRVVPILNSVGNAVSAVGGGADEINRVIKALGDIQARGKVATQELNQFAEVGLDVRRILVEQGIAKTTQELVKLTEQGAIPAKLAIDAILKGFESGRFAGAVEAQSKTLLGVFSTLKDQATSALTDVGNVLVPTAKRIIQDFIKPTLDGVTALAKGFAQLPPAAQDAILGITAIGAAAGPTILVVGQLVQSLTSIVSLYGQLAKLNWVAAFPIAGKVAAVAAAVFGLVKALELLSERYDTFGKKPEAPTAKLQEFANRSEIADRVIGGATNGVLRQSAAYEQLLASVRATTEAVPKIAKVGDAVGTNKAASELDKFRASLNATTQQAKELETSTLPDWLTRISDNALKAVAQLDRLAGGFAAGFLKNAVAEEVAKRNEQAFRKSIDAITDFLTAGEPFGKKLETDAAKLDEFAAASLSSSLALNVLNDSLARNSQVSAVALTGVERFKTKLEDFGIRTAASARKELEDLNRVIDDLFRQRSAAGVAGGDQIGINNDINNALERRKQLQIELGEVSRESGQRQRESLIEVSTITTNLSQSLARLAFDGGKFGETMVKVFKQIGESITANVLQKLIQSSGVVDAIGKGLGSVLKQIPGLGKLGGALGGGSSAAGSVLGGGGSAASAASQAISSTALQSISAITGVVSAVTGVIGVFQQAGTNRRLSSLNQTATGQLNQAIAQQETFNLYLPSLPQIHDRLKQIITNGLGVYGQPNTSIRVLVEKFLDGAQATDGARLQLIADRLNPLAGMADRLAQIVTVGVPVYNAPGIPFQVAGSGGFDGAAAGSAGVLRIEGAVIGGPFADASIDWLTDRIAERLQKRGVKVG